MPVLRVFCRQHGALLLDSSGDSTLTASAIAILILPNPPSFQPSTAVGGGGKWLENLGFTHPASLMIFRLRARGTHLPARVTKARGNVRSVEPERVPVPSATASILSATHVEAAVTAAAAAREVARVGASCLTAFLEVARWNMTSFPPDTEAYCDRSEGDDAGIGHAAPSPWRSLPRRATAVTPRSTLTRS